MKIDLETGIDVITAVLSTVFLVVRNFKAGAIRFIPFTLILIGIVILAGVVVS